LGVVFFTAHRVGIRSRAGDWLCTSRRVREIFAVQVLPHRFPELLEMDGGLLGNTYALPDEALADVKWLPENQGKAGEG
jgi:hypothetical protein